MTDADRLAALKARLAARKGKQGFEENRIELEAEIARLEEAQKSVTDEEH